MSATRVVFFKEADGSVPFRGWLDTEVARRDRRAAAKVRQRLDMLRQYGRDLRRPLADTLEEGIYELRSQFGRVNYRVLYFFHGRTAAVVSHGIAKESRVPRGEIELAIRRKKLFESDPEGHSCYEEEEADH